MQTNVRLPGGTVIAVRLPHDAESLNDWVPVAGAHNQTPTSIEKFLMDMDEEDEAAILSALEADIAFEKANP